MILHHGQVLRQGSVARASHAAGRTVTACRFRATRPRSWRSCALKACAILHDNGRGELRVAVPAGWVTRAFFALADNHGVAAARPAARRRGPGRAVPPRAGGRRGAGDGRAVEGCHRRGPGDRHAWRQTCCTTGPGAATFRGPAGASGRSPASPWACCFRRRLFWVLYALGLLIFLMFFFGQYLLAWAETQARRARRSSVGGVHGRPGRPDRAAPRRPASSTAARRRIAISSGTRATWSWSCWPWPARSWSATTSASAACRSTCPSRCRRWHYLLGKCLAVGVVRQPDDDAAGPGPVRAVRPRRLGLPGDSTSSTTTAGPRLLLLGILGYGTGADGLPEPAAGGDGELAAADGAAHHVLDDAVLLLPPAGRRRWWTACTTTRAGG